MEGWVGGCLSTDVPEIECSVCGSDVTRGYDVRSDVTAGQLQYRRLGGT